MVAEQIAMSGTGFFPALNPGLSQYHTPRALARRIVEWADVRDATVLEPSAGGGVLVEECLRAGARHVTAVELDPEWARVLRSNLYGQPVAVVEGDFLRVPVHSALVAVMNPPLNDGVAAEHLARALEWAPRVVSLLRSQDLHGQGRYSQLWSKAHLARVAYLVRRPIFVGDGGATEFVVVDVRRGPVARQSIEHWVVA